MPNMAHYSQAQELGYRSRCDSMDSDSSTASRSSAGGLSASVGEFVPRTCSSSAASAVEVVPTERSAADRYQYDRNPTGILISTAGGQTVEIWSGVVVPKSWRVPDSGSEEEGDDGAGRHQAAQWGGSMGDAGAYHESQGYHEHASPHRGRHRGHASHNHMQQQQQPQPPHLGQQQIDQGGGGGGGWGGQHGNDFYKGSEPIHVY